MTDRKRSEKVFRIREKHNSIIRPLRSEDREAIRQICCKTAFRNAGSQAYFEDDELHADYWTSYFTDHASNTSWVIEEDGEIIGYFLGCVNHDHFLQTMKKSIVPRYVLRALWRLATLQYKKPQTRRYLYWFILKAWREFPPVPAAEKPAHYHCNMLKKGYSRGYYTELTLKFLDELDQRGVSKIHGYITEGPEKGIWNTFAKMCVDEIRASGDPDTEFFFSEKSSTLNETVLHLDKPLINRAWAVKISNYRKWILWLRDSYHI
ncbi:MAG: hypothetical protein AAF478_07960 [Pseudomonadota bacterium]